MYFVPVLVAVDASNPLDARLAVATGLHERTAHIGHARHLSQFACAAGFELGDRAGYVRRPHHLAQLVLATAGVDLRVYANTIELPPLA